MATVITSATDVVNLALTRIGFKDRIGNLLDGSRASQYALNIYGQTRDELLRQNDWQFAERNVVLTLLKTAPYSNVSGYGYVPPTTWTTAYPPLPWFFEYAYPVDCLKVRAVKGVPILIPDFNPKPQLFGLENDNALDTPAKVILCNVPNAVLVYTGQVTNPASWEPDFVEALAAALGRRLAPVLVSPEMAKFAAGDEANAQAVAEKEQG